MIYLHLMKQLITICFLAMLYLKYMHTDHSCIENSDIETKHLIFENNFLTKTKNQIQLEITYSSRQTHSTQKCFA